MDTATLALVISAVALGAVIVAIFLFAPGRNAALGAWSLACWARKRGPEDRRDPS